MKKIILFVVAMVAAVSAIASDQVYVIMKDGSVESYPTDKVDSITIEPHQVDRNNDFQKIVSEIDQLKKKIEALKSNDGGENLPLYSASGSLDGHEFVDLGLPSGLKWATMNVGAKEVNDYGTYFAWGETAPAPEYLYSYDNCYAYGNSSSSLIDMNGNLTAKYDAATQNWGKNWRIPTAAEFEELVNNCTWTWTSLGGVQGYKVASKVAGNTNWIFLPAAGYRWNTMLNGVTTKGIYWSSTVTENSIYYSRCFSFTECSISDTPRSQGSVVRPVSK